jgi:hypothetical protein
MMAGYHVFTIDQGATWSREVTWTGQNITGYTVRMQLRRKVTDESAIIELSTTNGKIALTSPSTGMVTLNLTATETAALSGEYVYDLEFVNGAVVTRLLEGRVSVSPEVTR